ncbi:MAG: hypothetical protein V3V15_07740 [Sphingorhabdus sp.]
MEIEYIIFMIPFAGIALGAYAVWADHRLKMLDKQSEISAEKAAQYAANNERLEQRVATLETIITDKGFDVASQIEDLRDRPLN